MASALNAACGRAAPPRTCGAASTSSRHNAVARCAVMPRAASQSSVSVGSLDGRQIRGWTERHVVLGGRADATALAIHMMPFSSRNVCSQCVVTSRERRGTGQDESLVPPHTRKRWVTLSDVEVYAMFFSRTW